MSGVDVMQNNDNKDVAYHNKTPSGLRSNSLFKIRVLTKCTFYYAWLYLIDGLLLCENPGSLI